MGRPRAVTEHRRAVVDELVGQLLGTQRPLGTAGAVRHVHAAPLPVGQHHLHPRPAAGRKARGRTRVDGQPHARHESLDVPGSVGAAAENMTSASEHERR